jgi:arylsulfatase A-like enzyme
VILIIVDDMNTWTSVLNKDFKIHTPNFERLAKRSVTFTKAYAPSTLCAPSRTAVLTGLHPYRNGVYSNYSDGVRCLIERETDNIFNYFKRNGYSVFISGKLFHQGDHLLINFDKGQGWYELENPNPDTHWMFDWGVRPEDAPPLTDTKTAEFASEILMKKHKKPFIMGLGFIKPHMPWIVDKKYFDLYPLDEIKVTEYIEGDLDDVPETAKKLAKSGYEHWQALLESNKEKEAIQAYLASISFMDEELGRVLDALEQGPHNKNTIIVLLSDHGYHLGSKEIIRKGTLWEESALIPYFISIPNFKNNGKFYNHVTPVINTYATLIELCGLAPNNGINGESLVPILNSLEADEDSNKVAITMLWYQPTSIRTDEWRYTRYLNTKTKVEEEELYNVIEDPLQLTNLAGLPEYSEVKKELRKNLPKNQVKACPNVKN